MALKEKYAALIATTNVSAMGEADIKENNNVLYITATVHNGTEKDQLWYLYNLADPDFRAGDLVLDISVDPNAVSQKMRVDTKQSNLNIRKGPGTDTEIVSKAAHHSVVTLLSKFDDNWNLIKTDDGVEGYCSSAYLTAI
ncbi:MAG: SH3 domain-containing protein [Flavobacterium sp.]